MGQLEEKTSVEKSMNMYFNETTTLHKRTMTRERL